MIFENLRDACPKMETHDPNVYSTILGGVSRGFWTPFLDLGARSAIFWHLKTGIFGKVSILFLTTSLTAKANNWSIRERHLAKWLVLCGFSPKFSCSCCFKWYQWSLEADTLLTSKAPVPSIFRLLHFQKTLYGVFLKSQDCESPSDQYVVVMHSFFLQVFGANSFSRLVRGAKILIPCLWRKAEAEAKLYAFTNLAFLLRLENLIHS